MSTKNEINEKIEEIRNSDFEVKKLQGPFSKIMYVCLLKKAWICFYQIGLINISKEEKEVLCNELDEIMQNKLKELNPNFSEETLNNMLATYKGINTIWPLDIIVIDDAVFYVEAKTDGFGYIDEVRTSMFEGMRPYYHITDIEFEASDSIILPPWRNELSTAAENYYFKFISDIINSIHKKAITKPIYEQNYGNVAFGPPNIIETGSTKTFINMGFYNIVEHILKKEECDIKICVQEEDNIIIYYVHQHFMGDKPVWDVIKTNNEIWRLSEEILKLGNKQNPSLQKKKGTS